MRAGKMRILHLISSEGLYGAESMMVALCAELRRLGCDVTVGVFQDGRRSHTEVASAAEARGVNVRFFPCRSRADWKTVRLIRQDLDTNRVDILHSHGYKADVYAYLGSRRRRPILISTCHSWPQGARVLRLYAAIDRLALRAFDGVATMSREVAMKLARSGVRALNLHVISNGVDCAAFEHCRPTLRNELPRVGGSIVGLVARMVPAKGVPVFLRAARQVLKVDPDVTFVLIGGGPSQADFEQMAEELGVAQNVVFTGARRDMPGVYASLDVLALPSLEEAMPMAVLEGMSAGKPVIATPVGAIPELLIPEKTGYLTPVGDADALAASILKLVRNPALAEAMGRSGRERVRANFSVASAASSYLALYERARTTRKSETIVRGAIH
jgi:glycosyltransferase involved in cell wall biosynthesis